jgi:hypothetical protein
VRALGEPPVQRESFDVRVGGDRQPLFALHHPQRLLQQVDRPALRTIEW